jgi:hypothetical protein
MRSQDQDGAKIVDHSVKQRDIRHRGIFNLVMHFNRTKGSKNDMIGRTWSTVSDARGVVPVLPN